MNNLEQLDRTNRIRLFDAIVWLKRLTGTSWDWKDGKFVTTSNSCPPLPTHLRVANGMEIENTSSGRTLRALYAQGFTPTTMPIQRENGVIRFQYSVPEAEVFSKITSRMIG